jgi:hypothetical protein
MASLAAFPTTRAAGAALSTSPGERVARQPVTTRRAASLPLLSIPPGSAVSLKMRVVVPGPIDEGKRREHEGVGLQSRELVVKEKRYCKEVDESGFRKKASNTLAGIAEKRPESDTGRGHDRQIVVHVQVAGGDDLVSEAGDADVDVDRISHAERGRRGDVTDGDAARRRA